MFVGKGKINISLSFSYSFYEHKLQTYLYWNDSGLYAYDSRLTRLKR